MDQTTHIAVFGGSFNPPHADHMRILQYLVRDCSINLGHIIIAVVGDEHAHGKDLAPYADREKMVKDMVDQTLSSVYNMSGRRRQTHVIKQNEKYTVDFLQRLHQEFVEAHDINLPYRFHLVVGTDVLNDTHRWHKWDEVVSLATPLAIARGGEVKPEGYDWHMVDSTGLSSTGLREQVARGDLTHLEGRGANLPEGVFPHIVRKGLYGWKEPEVPPREVSIGSVVLPLRMVEEYALKSKHFSLVGPVKLVFRVSPDTDPEDDSPAVRFHYVKDTEMVRGYYDDLRRWHRQETERWAQGKEFNQPKPQTTGPPMFALAPGLKWETFPSSAVYLGTVEDYEFFTNSPSGLAGLLGGLGLF